MATHLDDLLALTADLQEEGLDQLVHDLKSSEATAVNNDGFQSQVKYLIEALGVEKAEQEMRFLMSIAPAKGDA